jgi:inorganic triphosphatase YgiF
MSHPFSLPGPATGSFAMEIEFKFHIPSERLDAVRADLLAAPCEQTRLQARYFDTADGLLAAHGAVLRLRKEGTRWVQTAKALGDGPLHRLEHNAELGPSPATAVPPSPDVQRHAGTPVGERLAALLATSKEPLVETYGTDIQRLSRIVAVPGADGAGETKVELALDVGHVAARGAGADATRTAPVCELELELSQGDVAGLVELARQWSGRHGLWFDTVSKAERGERLMAGTPTGAAVKATAPRFEAFAGTDRDQRPATGGKHGKHGKGARSARHDGPDGPAVQRAVVAACLAQMLPNASELAAGNDAADVTHQLRVGIRRLRTALREFASLGPGLDPAWEAPLVDAFRALGARRDEELMASELLPRLEAAGSPPIDLRRAAEADAPPPLAPGDVVRAPAFQAVLVELIAFTALPTPSSGEALDSAQARRQLRRRLRKLHTRLLDDAGRFDTLEAEARHTVRKRLKRLRYLAEFTASLFDTGRARRYLERLEPAQDALGLANDEATALVASRAAAQRDPRAWFAVGWLSAREPGMVRASGKALRGLSKAPKFWRHGSDTASD